MKGAYSLPTASSAEYELDLLVNAADRNKSR